jgi:hypothetical protein
MATLALRQRVGTSVSALRKADSSVFLQGITLYLLCFAVLTVLIFTTPAFFSTDDYYHARISEEIIKQGRLALHFPWLPLTILSPDKFVDHHLLYHIALAPAVYFFDMTGAKVVTVAIAAGIYLAAWWLFRNIGVRYPVIWSLGLFGMGATFVFRQLMIRTQGFSFLLLTLALIVFFNKRYKWLILLGFLYTWLYNGFVLMLVFAGMYSVSVLIHERRIEWRPVVYVGIGILLGLVINPYFPRNIAFVFEHLGAKVDLDSSVPLGSEWSAFNTRTWLTALGGPLLAMVLGFIKPSFGGKRDAVETTLMLCALVTGYMAWNSMRFLEYFPGFALMFCAASCGRERLITMDWHIYRRYARYAVPAVLIAALAYFNWDTLTWAYDLGVASKDVREYEGAGNWLERYTPPGTMVFTVGFNDFSRLFFYNQQNIYLIGLDPTYLQYASQHLWDEYARVINGEAEKPSEVMANVFHAQYAVSATRHLNFNRSAAADPDMTLVFRDEFDYVWRVSDAVYNRAMNGAS